MSVREAAETLGREYFKDLIPHKPCSKSRDLQWNEIRVSFKYGGFAHRPNTYSLVHACAEYGHEVLLSLLSELTRNINYYDSQSNTALARAIIGVENGMKVPAAISRILLKNGSALDAVVNSEGVYASQKVRSSPETLYCWAKNGLWPWPDTRDLVMERGKKRGL